MNYVIDRERVAFFDNYFYRKPQPIAGADASTFRVLAQWFGADREHVYFLHNIVTGADPASFVYLGGYNWQWAKDQAHVYCFWPSKAATRWRVLESQRVAHFQILPGCRFAEYAGDGELVFYAGKLIHGCEAPSFQIMPVEQIEDKTIRPSIHFARDRSRIYFDGKPLKQANPNTFRVISSALANNAEYGIDGVNAFFKDWARGKLVIISQTALPASLQANP